MSRPASENVDRFSVWEVEDSNTVPETEAVAFKSLYLSFGGQIVEFDSLKGPGALIINSGWSAFLSEVTLD